METCKICKEAFKNLKALSTHIHSKHNLCSKQYYDNFLLCNNENECVVCGKTTTFRGFGVGYLKNCSVECRNKNIDYRNKQSESKKGVKQSKETIFKRIKNTNQEKKESVRKKTMLNKYGVDNPTKIESIKTIISNKLIGKKKIRSDEWQKNIIESKRKNNTLKHTKETKNKIRNKLNKFYSENFDREKYITESNNVRHLSGWYEGLYFRSSLELSFLVNNSDKILSSCENNKYKIIYEDNGKKRVYFPDFTDGQLIYEIKPTALLEFYNNSIKIKEGKNVYGDKYKVITENESPYIKKKIIIELINSGKIKLTNRAEKVLEKYKF